MDASIFAGREMAQAEAVPVAGGLAGVISTRSPGKLSPNEDSAAVLCIAPRNGLLIVADGMGGGPAGDVASRTAIESLIQSVAQRDDVFGTIREAILSGFESANRWLVDQGAGSATTLVVAELFHDSLRTYHAGDSTLLVIGPHGTLRKLTTAHSPVGYGIESGLLDPDEAILHKDRHLISNLVGSRELYIEVGTALELQAADTVLLASDGLFDNLHLREIIEFARCGTPTQAAETLHAAAQARMLQGSDHAPSKPDDLTVLVYRRDPSTTPCASSSSGSQSQSQPSRD